MAIYQHMTSDLCQMFVGYILIFKTHLHGCAWLDKDISVLVMHPGSNL